MESRVLATLLTEMDGVGGGGDGGGGAGDCGVIVFAATNRLDCIDAALLRKVRTHFLLHSVVMCVEAIACTCMSMDEVLTCM